MATKKLTKAGVCWGGDFSVNRCVALVVDLRCRLGDDCKLFKDMVLVWWEMMLIVSSSYCFRG